MKIVALSDIHSNLDALQAVLSVLPAHDELYCLGDIVGYGPQPNEVIEILQQLRPTAVLLGNHDHAVVTGDVSEFSSNAAKAIQWTRERISEDSRHYLERLKPSARIELEGKTLALYHGSPQDPLMEYVFPGLTARMGRRVVEMAEANIVLLGHTHMPMVYRFSGEVLANPGSVGQPRDGDPRASFAVLTISQNEVRFDIQRVHYNVKPVADRILQSGLPSFLAERLYLGV